MLRRLVKLAAAVGGGLLLAASFAPLSWWVAAIGGLALLGWVLADPLTRAVGGFGYGLIFGLAFYLPLLPWVGVMVGPVPWVALAVVCAVFPAVFAVPAVLLRGLAGWPLWWAAWWTAVEGLKSVFPFGGFPWGTVGFGQADGPMAVFARLGGVALVSFITALVSFCIAAVIQVVRRSVRNDLKGAVALPVLCLALVTIATAAIVPIVRSSTGQVGPSVTVAVVQGNVPRLGLDFNAQRRAVLDNHVKETLVLAAEVAAGKLPKPDLVIWPENSSDIDPLRNADAAAQIERAAQAVDVPILVGAVLQNPDGQTTSNSALVWEPGVGVVERADKRRVQPFGEYMPWRGFFRLFSSYVDRAGYFVPGTGPGVVDMAGTKVGVTICWEVAFDDLVKDSVDNGAQVLAVPSNNATFGFTQMTYQQMAMSQVRSVEHDRTSIIATTSGVSATIDPDGTVTQSTTQFTPAVLVNRTELRDTVTLATRLGAVPEAVLVALGVGAVAVAVLQSRKRRTAGKDQDG